MSSTNKSSPSPGQKGRNQAHTVRPDSGASVSSYRLPSHSFASNLLQHAVEGNHLCMYSTTSRFELELATLLRKRLVDAAGKVRDKGLRA